VGKQDYTIVVLLGWDTQEESNGPAIRTPSYVSIIHDGMWQHQCSDIGVVKCKIGQ